MRVFGRRPLEVTTVLRIPNDISAEAACNLLYRDPYIPKTLAVYSELCVEFNITNVPADLRKHRDESSTGPFVGHFCLLRPSGILCVFDFIALKEIPEDLQTLLMDKSISLITFDDHGFSDALENTDTRIRRVRPRFSMVNLMELAEIAKLEDFCSLKSMDLVDIDRELFGATVSLALANDAHPLFYAAVNASVTLDMFLLMMQNNIALSAAVPYSKFRLLRLPETDFWNISRWRNSGVQTDVADENFS